MNGAFCDDKHVNEKMKNIVEIAKTVEFNTNSYSYLNSVYHKLAEIMQGNSNFLKDIECLSIFKIFERLLGFHKYNVEKDISVEQITSGDVLLIKCPSIFASYHFIIAAVNPAKTEVSVFQSYGSYKKLHKIVLSYGEFEKLLQDLTTFKSDDFDATYKMMIIVEDKLYGIKEREYIARLQEAKVNVNDNNLFLNNSAPENNSYVQRAKDLNIPPSIYEDLEHNFNINQSTLVINAYRIDAKSENAEGIKAKKDKRKTKKDKRKSKKDKRKTKKRKTKKVEKKTKKDKRKSKKDKRKTRSKKTMSKKTRSKK